MSYHAYILVGQPQARQSVLERVLVGVPKHNQIALEPESDSGQIMIDQIRGLVKRLNLRPWAGQYQAAIIDAPLLSRPAQVALLKTLEEPPRQTRIILTTSSLDYLLPTIISRCRVLKSLPAGPKDSKLAGQLTFGQLKALSLVKRLNLAKDLSGRQDLAIILDSWILELRPSQDLLEINSLYLKLLLELKRLIAQNVNRRIALESLLVKISL